MGQLLVDSSGMLSTDKSSCSIDPGNSNRGSNCSVCAHGYKCSGCGYMFPETRAPRGRMLAETRLLEKIHVQREFARHVCGKRNS
jgi:rubredoxin